MKRSLSYWQFAGYVFTTVAGTLLHFLFDWTGGNVIAGIFSAVNESIWEHMKLLYYPMLFFAIFESRYFIDEYKNYWCAKALGMVVGLLSIPILYYTYTGALGVTADWFNIVIFFIAGALSFYTETKIMKSGAGCPLSSTVSIIIIVLIGVIFTIFTFFPPFVPLFEDPLTKTYGINSKTVIKMLEI